MQGIALVGASLVLVVTVTVGLVAHELAHALVVHSLGIPYEIRWFPGQGETGLGRLAGTWAAVTPTEIPATVPTWGVQLSAVAPLVLAVPVFLAVPLSPGLSPAEQPAVAAAVVGWLACSLPSPQDFSVFWYADAAVRESRNAARSGE